MKADIILLDPPWVFNQRSAWNSTKLGGGCRTQYDVMTDEELKALGPLVQDIAAPKSALFMWHCPSRTPKTTVEIMEAMGFKYSTVAFVWVKLTKDGTRTIVNPGFCTGANIEEVYVGYHLLGKNKIGALRPENKLVRQVVFTQGRMPHSQKPEEVQDRLDFMFPGRGYKKVELFARRSREGWLCSGLELDGRDVGDFLRVYAAAES